MQTVLLIVHLLIAMGVVGLVLMQRSEGGALGMGGGGGGLISGRGAADVLARGTTILGVLFVITSLSLTLLAASRGERRSVIETAPLTEPLMPSTTPAPAPLTGPAPEVRAAPAPALAAPVDAAPAPVGAAPRLSAGAATPDARIAPAPPPNAERAAPAASRPAPEPEPAPVMRQPEAVAPPAPEPRLPPERAGPDE